jgi:hypothetical protein
MRAAVLQAFADAHRDFAEAIASVSASNSANIEAPSGK